MYAWQAKLRKIYKSSQQKVQSTKAKSSLGILQIQTKRSLYKHCSSRSKAKSNRQKKKKKDIALANRKRTCSCLTSALVIKHLLAKKFTKEEANICQNYFNSSMYFFQAYWIWWQLLKQKIKHTHTHTGICDLKKKLQLHVTEAQSKQEHPLWWP